MKLYANRKTYNAAVEQFTTSAKAINDQLHRLGCSVLNLAQADRNVDSFAKLINQVPPGMRRSDMAHWFNVMSNGAVKISKRKDKAGKVAYHAKLDKSMKGQDLIFDIDKAIATPFWNLREDRPVTAWNPIQDMRNLAKKLHKAAKGDMERPVQGVTAEEAERMAAGIEAMLEA